MAKYLFVCFQSQVDVNSFLDGNVNICQDMWWSRIGFIISISANQSRDPRPRRSKQLLDRPLPLLPADSLLTRHQLRASLYDLQTNLYLKSALRKHWLLKQTSTGMSLLLPLACCQYVLLRFRRGVMVLISTLYRHSLISIDKYL